MKISVNECANTLKEKDNILILIMQILTGIHRLG